MPLPSSERWIFSRQGARVFSSFRQGKTMVKSSDAEGGGDSGGRGAGAAGPRGGCRAAGLCLISGAGGTPACPVALEILPSLLSFDQRASLLDDAARFAVDFEEQFAG